MTSNELTAIILASSVGLSFLATPCVRYLAMRHGLIDHPSSRSSHTVPTPRGGGLAIVIAHFAALLELHALGYITARELVALMVGGGAVALVGILDDRRSLTSKVRFGVHLCAATIVVALIGGVPIAGLVPGDIRTEWIGQVVGVFAITWAINLFNFMDGIDGIAGVEAAFVSFAACAVIVFLGGSAGLIGGLGALGAASVGFLVWNWPPARIFMGDVGSGFIGFMLAALAIQISQHISLPLQFWPILVGVFLVDATVTLIRRMARGDNWLQAHRMHAYQHLARAWRGHLPVTLLVCAINVCWLLPWAWLAATRPIGATLSLLVALLPLVIGAIIADAGRP